MSNSLLLSGIGDVSVTNSAAETTVFSATVPGGTLGSDGLLLIRMIEDLFNNTGAGQTYTLRIKFGGVTIHTFTTISITADPTNPTGGVSLIFLGAENATNSQRSMFEHKQTGPGSGAGGVSGGNDHNTSVNRSIAVDSTADQTLAITVQNSVADTNLTFRCRGVWVEKCKTGPATAIGDGVQLLKVDTTEILHRNISGLTDLWNITIPANTISTGNLVIIRVLADVCNNTGSTQNWVAHMKLNGSEVFNGGTTGVNNTSSTKRRAFPIEFWIGGRGTTGTQVLAVIGHTLNTFNGAGEGDLGTTGWQANQSTNTLTIDSTADITFTLGIRLNTASNDLDWRFIAGFMAVVKA